MKTTKVIKGVPIYCFHGKQCLEKPNKLVCGKMVYNDEENITYVHMHRKRYIIETLSVLIILLCILFTHKYKLHDEIQVKYNSIVNLYNGILYLNWLNPEDNHIDITYSLYDNESLILSRTLEPGEYLLTTEYTPNSDTLQLTISVKRLGKVVEDNVSLRVINRNENEVE